jgi:mRNA interferase RelE/StbE
MKTIAFTAHALKQFDALPMRIQEAIDNALDKYAISGIGDVKRLSGTDAFRLRVGEYRIIFDDDGFTVLAVQVGKRETTTYKRV